MGTLLPKIDYGQLEFSDPAYLWLLVIPAVLLGIWVWRFAQRRADARRLIEARVVPMRERFGLVGDLPC